jgi:hypothetical protein
MQKLLRLYERAERLEARMLAKAMRIPAKEQATFIARHIRRARQLNARLERLALRAQPISRDPATPRPMQDEPMRSAWLGDISDRN